MTGIALLGCGYWGRNIARVLRELGCLQLVCDPSPEGRSVAEALGVPWCADISDALHAREIRAVAIATPAVTHYELVQAALAADKDVFVEKPLALRLDQAEELGALAERSGRILMVGHLLQYHPAFLRMKEMVAQGALGQLRYVYSNRLNIGKLRKEENVLWSFAPHDISMILSLVGGRPQQVTALGHCYLQDRIADVTVTHLAFGGGVRAHVYVSWLNPFKEQKLVVVGESGMLVFDDTQNAENKLMLFRHRIEWRNDVPVAAKAGGEPVVFAPAEPLLEEMRHFLDCIERRARPRTDHREGADVLAVLNAAQASMECGKAVEIAPPRGAGAALSPAARPFFVHPTAVIDDGVVIGRGTRIWHFTHVLDRSRIGENCSIGQNVMIGPDVTVGNGCKIQNNVSLYKGVTLEDDVFCGPSMVFTNVRTPRAHVERKDEFAPTLIRRGATIGANATIVCGTTIGEYAMIGAGAVVTRDVPPYALVVGNPARRIGWVSASGERLGADLVCPRTGERYREAEHGIEPVPA